FSWPGDAKPHRAGRNLPAPRSAARSLHAEHRNPLSELRRRSANRHADHFHGKTVTSQSYGRRRDPALSGSREERAGFAVRGLVCRVARSKITAEKPRRPAIT